MKSRYYVTSLTGSTLVDRNGRSQGPETTGRTISQHRTLDRALAACDCVDGSPRRVVIDRRTGEIVTGGAS